MAFSTAPCNYLTRVTVAQAGTKYGYVRPYPHQILTQWEPSQAYCWNALSSIPPFAVNEFDAAMTEELVEIKKSTFAISFRLNLYTILRKTRAEVANGLIAALCLHGIDAASCITWRIAARKFLAGGAE